MNLLFKKKSKYGARKVTYDGHKFDSNAECSLYRQLILLDRADKIRLLDFQVRVPLTAAKIIYVADFEIFDLIKNEKVWIEFKGFETRDWKIKKRLWKFFGPGCLEIWKSNKSGLYLDEVIEPISKHNEHSVNAV